jgi:hypothetical protein
VFIIASAIRIAANQQIQSATLEKPECCNTRAIWHCRDGGGAILDHTGQKPTIGVR